MTKGLAVILRRVRQRPLRERRILAVTAYIAAAALITTVWVDSLKKSLSATSGDAKPVVTKNENNGRENGPGSAELNKTPALALNPKTPLQTLSAAVKMLISGAKEFNRAIGGLKKNMDFAAVASPPPAQPANQDTLSYGTSDETEANFSQPVSRANGAKIAADRGFSPAEIITRSLAEKSYSDSDEAAGLLLPGLEFTKAPTVK